MSTLDVIVWDVQHGNATFISTPNGKNVVIDLGVGSFDNSDQTFSPLSFLRTHWGIRRLDAVIVTHPHTDHLDDIFQFDLMCPSVLVRPKHLSDEVIYGANRPEDRSVVDKYLEIHHRYSAPIRAGESPFDPSVNGGAVFQTFHPKSTATSNLNNHSIVTVVSYAGLKMLIPGDNEKPSWSELLTDGSFRTAIAGTDVLLAPHHGRDAGFCEELFEYINPRLTIVSDGSVCDTSARDRYRTRSRGWNVFSNDGSSETRYCLTTGCDGTVRVSMGLNQGGGNFLSVKISR